MRADAERFFTALDSDQDGRIDSEERMIYESEDRAGGSDPIQTGSGNAPGRRPPPRRSSGEDRDRGDRRWRVNGIDGYQLDGLQGAARYGLLNLPEPVAGADANFDRSYSLDEFRRAAWLPVSTARQRSLGAGSRCRTSRGLAALPAQGGPPRSKCPKNAVDTRVVSARCLRELGLNLG